MNETTKALRKALRSKPVIPSGSVVKFTVRFGGEGRTYTYVALHVAGKWWISGSRAYERSMTMEAFMTLLASDDVVQAMVATEWEHVR